MKFCHVKSDNDMSLLGGIIDRNCWCPPQVHFPPFSWWSVFENDGLFHLTLNNICNSHVDISKLANLQDIICIQTRRRPWKGFVKMGDPSFLGDLKLIYGNRLSHMSGSLHINTSGTFCPEISNWPIRTFIFQIRALVFTFPIGRNLGSIHHYARVYSGT